MPIRVLIADDSASVRDAIRKILEKQLGVEVCAVTENGLDTIEKAKALRPDVIVLDLKMPGISGIEVAGILRKELPSAKTILFTLYAETISGSTASLLGMPVISKTDGLGKLVEMVRSLLASSKKQSLISESGVA